MKPEAAEILGVQALAWLLTQDDLFGVFLGSTGATVTDVKEQAQEPAFLGSVLDFVLMDDAWVVACCDSVGCPYDQVMRARAMLPGGEQVSWT